MVEPTLIISTSGPDANSRLLCGHLTSRASYEWACAAPGPVGGPHEQCAPRRLQRNEGEHETSDWMRRESVPTQDYVNGLGKNNISAVERFSSGKGGEGPSPTLPCGSAYFLSEPLCVRRREVCSWGGLRKGVGRSSSCLYLCILIALLQLWCERKVEAGWKGWGWSRSVFKAARMLPHNARMYVRGRLVSSSANSSGARGRGGWGRGTKPRVRHFSVRPE